MSQVRAQIEGMQKLKDRLAAIPVEARKGIARILRVGVIRIHKDATDSLLESGKTGALYHLSKPVRDHRASAPGEAPASDSGALRRSIKFFVDEDKLAGEVVANATGEAPYAAALEFGHDYGNHKIEPRPYMAPAFLKNKKAISGAILDEINRALKGGKK